MCGRFSLYHQPNLLARRFELQNLEELSLIPRFNIAPSQDILTIVHDGEAYRGGFLRWGLIPSFSKDKKIGYKMMNARAETLHEKPSFSRLLSRRRCVIPADGFFEWQKTEQGKIPLHIKRKDGDLFVMAGLWDRWQEPEGQIITSCTIITTEPNALMAPIHNRMPAMLDITGERVWLNRNVTDHQELQNLLQPFDDRLMKAEQVSEVVNSPKNDTPECIIPVNQNHTD